MPTQPRRERAREERRDLIVRTARDLAETEGWESVTTRRLAEAVDYSQPVLYGHFKNMDAIAAAVALEGFEELAAALRAARLSGASGRRRAAGTKCGTAADGLRAVARGLSGVRGGASGCVRGDVRAAYRIWCSGVRRARRRSRPAFGEILAGVTPFAGRRMRRR